MDQPFGRHYAGVVTSTAWRQRHEIMLQRAYDPKGIVENIGNLLGGMDTRVDGAATLEVKGGYAAHFATFKDGGLVGD